jgi:hypothetical protein
MCFPLQVAYFSRLMLTFDFFLNYWKSGNFLNDKNKAKCLLYAYLMPCIICLSEFPLPCLFPSCCRSDPAAGLRVPTGASWFHLPVSFTLHYSFLLQCVFLSNLTEFMSQSCFKPYSISLFNDVPFIPATFEGGVGLLWFTLSETRVEISLPLCWCWEVGRHGRVPGDGLKLSWVDCWCLSGGKNSCSYGTGLVTWLVVTKLEYPSWFESSSRHACFSSFLPLVKVTQGPQPEATSWSWAS